MFMFRSKDIIGAQNAGTEVEVGNEAVSEADAANALHAIMEGRFSPDIAPDGPLAQAIFELADRLKGQACSDLDRTVKFSIQASEAMVSVSNITSDVREGLIRHLAGV